MDESGSFKSSGKKPNIKTFLIHEVRHLSRIYAGKNKGQEKIWDKRPSNYPRNLPWKNPTSAPKDSVETLQERYKYLLSVIPLENIPDNDRKAFEDFKNNKMDSVKCNLLYKSLTAKVNDIRIIIKENRELFNESPELKAFQERFNLFDKTLSPSEPSSQKRKTENSVELLPKKRKTESQNLEADISNGRSQLDKPAPIQILPKPPQPAEFSSCTYIILSNSSSIVNSASNNTFLDINLPQPAASSSLMHHTNINSQNSNSENENILQSFNIKNSNYNHFPSGSDIRLVTKTSLPNSISINDNLSNSTCSNSNSQNISETLKTSLSKKCSNYNHLFTASGIQQVTSTSSPRLLVYDILSNSICSNSISHMCEDSSITNQENLNHNLISAENDICSNESNNTSDISPDIRKPDTTDYTFLNDIFTLIIKQDNRDVVTDEFLKNMSDDTDSSDSLEFSMAVDNI